MTGQGAVDTVEETLPTGATESEFDEASTDIGFVSEGEDDFDDAGDDGQTEMDMEEDEGYF